MPVTKVIANPFNVGVNAQVVATTSMRLLFAATVIVVEVAVVCTALPSKVGRVLATILTVLVRETLRVLFDTTPTEVNERD